MKNWWRMVPVKRRRPINDSVQMLIHHLKGDGFEAGLRGTNIRIDYSELSSKCIPRCLKVLLVWRLHQTWEEVHQPQIPKLLWCGACWTWISWASGLLLYLVVLSSSKLEELVIVMGRKWGHALNMGVFCCWQEDNCCLLLRIILNTKEWLLDSKMLVFVPMALIPWEK